MAAAAAVVVLGLALPGAAEAKQWLYTANNGSDDVSGFAIAGDGSLSLLPGFPVAAGDSPGGIAITPDGRRLYVPSRLNSRVSGYAIGADGSLSPLPGSPWTVPGPDRAAVDPKGKRLYVVGALIGSLYVYDIGADGSLTAAPGTPFALGSAGWADLAFAPDGRHLYVSNTGGDAVTALTVGEDGALTIVPGAPFAAGDGPVGLTVRPDGTRLYVANVYDNTVGAYAIRADGSLAPVAGAPYTAEFGPQGIAATPDGRWVFAASLWWDVFAFGVGADGTLSPVAGSPFQTPADERSMGIATSADGTHLYTHGTNTDDVATYTIGADGVPAPAGPAVATGGTGGGLGSVAMTPNQGPTARLQATVAGHTAALDASASMDADGTVARYAWDFGDGTTATTTTPRTAHTYVDGTFTASVTVTDAEGCSTALVFTGQVAHCNGSSAARASTQLTFTATPPAGPPSGPASANPPRDVRVDGARLSARKRQRQRRTRRHAVRSITVTVRAGAREQVALLARGRITVTPKRAKRTKSRRVSFPLRTVKRSRVGAGRLSTLRLKPRRSKDARRIARALREHRSVLARVEIRFTDAGGNRRTLKRIIRLR